MPIRGLVAKHWQLVVGIGLVLVKSSSVYMMTAAPWAVILILGATLAVVLLARYRRTVTIFSGEAVGGFSVNRDGPYKPAVACDPV